MLIMMFSCRRFKAQSAFEFIFIFGILLSVLTLGMWVSLNKTREVNRYQVKLEVDYVLTTVAEKINTVWLEGEGFSTNVTIPETVTGKVYTLNMTSNYIILTLETNEYVKPIIMQNLTGNFTIGAVNNLYNRGDYIEIS